jgi:C4-dicarboxylate-specific signal transduction histidine kinase
VRHSLEVSGEFEAEYRVMARDGATRWVVARGQVERDADGKRLRLRGVTVDVTERKQAEAELQRLQGELAHVSRVSTVGQLSNTLAHELNQPLAIILTNAQAAQRLLAQEPPDLAEARDILADIVSEDERAGEVIKRLRALLKPGQTHLQPLSVNVLVEDVLRIARSDLIERGIKVHTELDGSVPPVMGDRVQLQQVLLNLILNAGEAMASNPPADRHLTIGAAHCDGTVRISFSDTGCGLPPDAERIFEPFYTTKKEGLGLGLPICRSIISAHNGRLRAEANAAAGPSAAATASRGATFHLELPAAAEGKP